MSINSATGLIQWMPTNAQVGQHMVRVVVRDSGGLDAAQSFTITVANVNDPPVITSTPLTQALTGMLYSYAVVAMDPDVGDALSYSLTTAPPGMSITTNGLIQWTATSGQAGDHPVAVQVRDAAGLTAVQSYTLTVKQVVTVPNVVGLTQTAAEAALRAANLVMGAVTEEYSDTAPQGEVIRQDPASGLQVAAGSAVALVVSKGPEPITAKTLNLLLNQNVVNGGDSLSFTYEVLDNNGNVMAPTPAVDLHIQFTPAQTTGTPPSISGSTIITAV